jgi:microsomal dipeptidase-like Zn-dependent dipeptidase
MPNYFDSHIHLSTKHFVTSPLVESKWNVDRAIDARLLLGLDEICRDRLDSQSYLGQLQSGNVNLVVTALYAFEKELIPLIRLPLILDHDIMDDQMLFDIRDGKVPIFCELLLKEIDFMIHQQIVLGNKMNLMKSWSELDPSKINVVLSMEGAHCLIPCPYPKEDNADLTAPEKELTISNLLSVKNRNDVRIIWMNLCHFTNNPFCIQAYGMPDLKKKFNEFIPKSGRFKGLSEFGKQILRTALQNTSSNPDKSNRILIDIKHMSLYSRLDYYQLLQDEFSDESIPIVCTHAAPAGMSIGQRFHTPGNQSPQSKVKRSKGINGTYFNPCSINLYDEEIRWIVSRKGLITLSLDQRILGCPNPTPYWFNDPIIEEEYNAMMGHPMQGPLWENDQDETKEYDSSRHDARNEFDQHLDHFCNAILRLVWAGGPDTWNQIALGSDLDGLVDAVNCCKTIADYPNFETNLVRRLPEIAAMDPEYVYFTKTVLQHVRDLMFENGKNFIQNHL